MKTAGEDLGKQVKSRDRSHGEKVEEFVWNQLIRYELTEGCTSDQPGGGQQELWEVLKTRR